jgi:ribosomal protein S18 acetylase RimI-like enzyme
LAPEIEIRPFRPDDAAAVIALWQRCDLTRPWNDPAQDIERKLAVQSHMFLVASDGAAIVGSVMAGYEGHRGWINYLAVLPELRRNGIARELMSHAERLLRQAGAPKINLQVRATNLAVQSFYRALGYEVDEVISMGKRLLRDS